MSEVVRNMLKAAADCLCACDSELSAQAHSRPPSSKEELTALYRRCRKLYEDINGALKLTAERKSYEQLEAENLALREQVARLAVTEQRIGGPDQPPPRFR